MAIQSIRSTLTVMQDGQLVDLEIMTCPVCGQVMLQSDELDHSDWHSRSNTLV